jgi:diadenosine tetraphosphatase ApaH/serine/threonine PP2A family protein phosphatase
MLIALLTDIHGNREALEACLADARRRGAERLIFLGDCVGYGADPGFVVDTVRAEVERGAVALLGNHDEAVFGSDERMNDDARAAIRWTRDQLDEGQRRFLEGLPLTYAEGERLFVHANAYSPAGWDYVTGRLQAGRSMATAERRLTFCGHVHAPALYHMDQGRVSALIPAADVGVPLAAPQRWLAVIGAVGQPRDGNPAAAYALLEGEPDVLTTIRVPYDVEQAARKILAAGLPPRLAARLHHGR